MRVLIFVLLAACGSLQPGGPNRADSGAGDMAQGPMFATPYFPMQDGLSWQLKQTNFDGTVGSDCYNNGSMLSLSMTKTASGVAMNYSPACFYSAIDYAFANGTVTQTTSGGTYNAFAFPPVQGKTWVAGGASGVSYSWDTHYDTYTVAAGTFDDCWRSKIDGQETWQILCRDVGVVVSSGDTYQDYRWELVSKSF